MVNIIKIKIKQSLGVAGLGSPIAEIPWGWYRHTPPVAYATWGWHMPPVAYATWGWHTGLAHVIKHEVVGPLAALSYFD